MDPEKSSNSSFEDLSNLNEVETKITEGKERSDSMAGADSSASAEEEVLDIIGNGQLLKKVIKASDSECQPTRGDLVRVTYVGKLDDGMVVENEVDFEIHVGDVEVVQGLDMAIPLMKVGEVAEVSVDSRFAYGALGLKNDQNPTFSIPPNAKITYNIELLECKQEDEADLKSFALRKKMGNRKRERANFWYNRNEFNIAIQIYRRALEYLDDTDGGISLGHESELTNAELQELLEDRLVVYNNLAMAQIKISAYDAALKSVEHVLRCQPNNSKALFRKGRILDAKGDTKGAIALLQKAATLEPDSKSIQQDLAKLIIKSRREERNEKEMYQKMLGQAKKFEQKNKKSENSSNDIPKLKLLGYLMGSILIGVAGVAMYRYKY
ncbi:unnamed protein product [Hermetia illucens]|uniref:peptidylprolyl isomerase n=1 Tax=Hermetia illucens TaxID=343691 RepID=A0A7R8Z0W5_HERIL|nr:peptidyl-prolyl cis-trans isomerase FKBP8 isoform X2 [Hermetia illucens]CAD7091956.1 unnamed protein product [Hermetia illucens]